MKKKIALITGASGGIGGACAETLARAGYTVLLHGCHGLEHAKVLADRLCAEGCDAHAVCCDLADSESAQAMCRDILALYHRVDALVLCAGVSHTGLFCDMTDEQWRTVMDVNVSGMFYLIRALAPGMIARNEGAIVTVSSMWGRVGASCEVAYSASKAAVIGLTRALAKELGPSGRARQLHCARRHQYAHDGRTQRRNQGRAGGRNAALPSRHAAGRGGRLCVFALGRGRLHHGAGFRCGRRLYLTNC